MANRQYTVSAIVDQNKLQKSAQVALTSQTIKIPVDVQAKGITDLKVASTTMSKLTDSAGNTRVEIDKFNASGEKLGTTIKNTSKGVKTLGQDFTETFGKVLKFGTITAIIGLFTQGISEAIQTVKEFDDAVTEFSKVSDYSREEIQAYSDTLGELGESVYRTKTEMLDAATSFKKSGFSESEAATLSRVAALYQNIADEELSAADASEVIISQMKAFTLGAEDAEHIVDAINIVSNEFAVSSSDIGKGLTAAGAALSTYGNDFEEVIGLK